MYQLIVLPVHISAAIRLVKGGRDDKDTAYRHCLGLTRLFKRIAF